MHPNARLLPIVIAALPLTLPAQQGVREQPPLYRAPTTMVYGVFVTPISGAPFTATVLIRSEEIKPDGSVESRRTATLIARDSRGRIRNERHMMVPETYTGDPPLLLVHIYDPATRVSNFYNPATLISRTQIVPAHEGIGEFNHGPNSEDLGFTTLNDLQARGTRVTRNIAPEASGTGNPVQVVDEFWYSEELHMNLLERHTDVRGGVQTVAITSIKREEPPPALFEVPEGYKIVDVTPPANAPVSRAVDR
jgi:hypothetical protein